MNQVNLCKKHNKEIIGLDFTANQSLSEKQLCLICLVPILKKQSIITVDNAVEIMTNIKSEFSLKMEEQNNMNLDKIKTLLSDVVQIKTTMDQQFMKLIDNIQRWITNVEEQNVFIKTKISELSTLNVEEFEKSLKQLQENNYGTLEIKESISQQLMQIAKGDKVLQSLKLLESIEFVEQNTDCTIYSQDVIEPYRTPNLQLICNEHNNEIVFLDLNEKRHSENRLACIYCQYDNKACYTPVKIAEEQWNEYKKQRNQQINQLEEQEKSKISQLKLIFSSLNSVYVTTINDITTYLDQTQQEIDQIIIQQTQQYNRDWNSCSKEQIIEITETLSLAKTQRLSNLEQQIDEKDKQINKKINDQLHKLNEKLTQSNDKVKRLIEFNDVKFKIEAQTQTYYMTKDNTTQNDIQVISMDKQLQTFLIQSQNITIQTDRKDLLNNTSQTDQVVETQLAPAYYKLLDQYSIQQNEQCFCFCFNKDQNILAVGCQNDIKVFRFDQGRMTQIQLLKGHTSGISALYIGNNNKIYSCSGDNTIKIWIQWKLLQSLEGHTDQVVCIVVNRKEDLFLTGSLDKSIKCWMKEGQQLKCTQTLQHHNSSILSLSFNESQNQVLSCGRDNRINIYKLDSKKQWSLSQTITVDDYAYRASFIGDNTIVYQMESKGVLRIFEYNNNEFKQKQDIQVKGSGGCYYFFPQWYCNQQRILVNKHCQFINIIRVKKDNTLVIEQVIEYKTNQLYGTITEDSKYLLTWDYESKQIQVRQLE